MTAPSSTAPFVAPQSRGAPAERRSRRRFAWLDIAVALWAAILGALVFRAPLSAHVRVLNIDDSFYYFAIARNFAHGLYSTVDGVHLTNGYHPLWAALLTPVFALVGDPVRAIRVAKLVELALLLCGGLLIAAGGRRAGWPPLLAAVAPMFLLARPVLYDGMETAIQVLLFGGLMYALVRLFTDGARRWRRIIVLICCLLPWARLEDLSAGVMALGVLSAWTVRDERRSWRAALAPWTWLSLSLALYFAYNWAVFGSPLPVSGAIKNYWSSLRFAQAGGYDLVANLTPYALAHRRGLFLSLVMAAAATLSWLAPAYRARRLAASHATDAFVLILTATYLARLAYAVLFVDHAYDNAYYYVSPVLLEALAGPYLFSRAALLTTLLGGARRPGRAVVMATTAAAALGLVWLAHPWTVVESLQRIAPAPTWQQASYQGAEWMSRNLPRDAVVGSPDSGIVGYFTTRRVVNLDGVVNSQDFFRAIKAGGVEEWMRREGVTHLANPVPIGDADGCAFIAAGSAQPRGYLGCRLVYRGPGFEQVWLGQRNQMEFRVYALPGSAVVERRRRFRRPQVRRAAPPRTGRSTAGLVLRYGLFALLSTLLNLAVQSATLMLLRPALVALPVAMAGGTVAGFALKYLLDKHWIFHNRTQTLGRELRQIILYGMFSVATTAVFWGTESLFALIWRTPAATLVGATLGLCLGYFAKYLLDNRFTFRTGRRDVPSGAGATPRPTGARRATP